MKRHGEYPLRHGFTLLELVIVIAVLGVSAVVSLATLGGISERESGSTVGARIASARERAIKEGNPVVVTIRDSLGQFRVIALPDGGVIADTGLHVDRLTGRRPDALR